MSETRDGPVTHIVLVTDGVNRDDLLHMALEGELKKLPSDIFIGLPMPVRHRQA